MTDGSFVIGDSFIGMTGKGASVTAPQVIEQFQMTAASLRLPAGYRVTTWKTAKCF